MMIAAVSYWHIRDAEQIDAEQIDVEQIASGCIVRFAAALS